VPAPQPFEAQPFEAQPDRLGRPAGALAGHRDFRLLWSGLAISQAGTAVGGAALPVVAVTLLGASTFEVTLLAAVGAVTGALLALPVGSAVEFGRKRPAMIGADVLRCLALASVPAAYLAHLLSFGQLCVVAALVAAGQVLFQAAAQAHLVALVRREALLEANGRLQASTWLSLSVGPSLGGVLVSVIGATGTVLVDALSYLASAVAVRRIGRPEPPPPPRSGGASRLADLGGGWRFVAGRPDLRRLLVAWVVFAGSMGLTAPLTSLLYLRLLGFAPWQYGLILGLPSLAGFAGSRLTGRSAARFGALPVLRAASYLRVPGLLVPVFAPRGGVGVALCCLGFGWVLLFSSLANATMTGYRQLVTPSSLLARVASLWSFATSAGQPVFVLAGGALAVAVGVRPALLVAAAGALGAAAVLPRVHPGLGISESIQTLGPE